MFLLGGAATGVWLASTGLVTLERNFALSLGGSCSFGGKAQRDVRALSITGVFEKLLPTVQVETCGLLGPNAVEQDRAAADERVKRADSLRRPFLVAQEIQGTDSVLARARCCVRTRSNRCAAIGLGTR